VIQVSPRRGGEIWLGDLASEEANKRPNGGVARPCRAHILDTAAYHQSPARRCFRCFPGMVPCVIQPPAVRPLLPRNAVESGTHHYWNSMKLPLTYEEQFVLVIVMGAKRTARGPTTVDPRGQIRGGTTCGAPGICGNDGGWEYAAPRIAARSPNAATNVTRGFMVFLILSGWRIFK